MATSTHQTLRLALRYDLSTDTVLDGVEITLPPGVPLPKTVEEVHAVVDRLVRETGHPDLLAQVGKQHPGPKDWDEEHGHQEAIRKAVAKVRAILVHPSKAAADLVRERGIVARGRLVP